MLDISKVDTNFKVETEIDKKDICHPTDFGFVSMAEALTEVIIRYKL